MGGQPLAALHNDDKYKVKMLNEVGVSFKEGSAISYFHSSQITSWINLFNMIYASAITRLSSRAVLAQYQESLVLSLGLSHHP